MAASLFQPRPSSSALSLSRCSPFPLGRRPCSACPSLVLCKGFLLTFALFVFLKLICWLFSVCDVRKRERKSVCGGRERERERVCVCLWGEREREREKLGFASDSLRSTAQGRAFDDEANVEKATHSQIDLSAHDIARDERKFEQNSRSSTAQITSKDSLKLLSVSPLPLLAIAALPGAGTVAGLFEPIAEVVRNLDLPDWLLHWGHPGNMAVVLFAMGGYGSYLGWQIRLSDDVAVKAKAKDLHPKLLGGMFFFFSLGATGGILSLLTSGKPIFESPHAVTGLLGLALLTAQTTLSGFFEGNSSLRGVHAFLGSGIMLLFLVHAVFGLQLGLSY